MDYFDDLMQFIIILKGIQSFYCFRCEKNLLTQLSKSSIQVIPAWYNSSWHQYLSTGIMDTKNYLIGILDRENASHHTGTHTRTPTAQNLAANWRG